MDIYEVDDGEQHWYAAASKKDALKLHLEPLLTPDGILEDYHGIILDEIVVKQLAPETILPVCQDDGTKITKTAAEWAAEGEGLVGSTVW